MINHVRTLLMNRGRNGHSVQEPGEEYIPADFHPRVLTQTLRLVQTILFGTQPDRLYVNYRMRQLLQMMHATPLSDDISMPDSRITYLPFKDDLFDSVFRTSYTVIAGPDVRIHIAGSNTTATNNNLAKQTWDVEVTAPGEATVTKRFGRHQIEVIDIHGEKPATLPGSQLLVYLHSAPVGYHIQVNSVARPAVDIAQLLTSLQNGLGSAGTNEIFPVSDAEPLATWRRIWVEHNDFAMRFTALLLAIAYVTEQQPQEKVNV